MLPYTATSSPRTIALTAAMFTASRGAPVANTEADVCTLRTADGHMTILKGNAPVRMYLQARLEVTRTASADNTALVQVVQVNGAGRLMSRTARAGRAFPSSSHPDVIAYTSADNGATWQPANVTACNFIDGSVSVSVPGLATRTRVYYVFADGEVTLKGSRPFGTSGGSVQIWNYPARSLHELNQSDTSAAPVVANREIGLPQGFVLSIAVRAFSSVYFDRYAQHEINIPAFDVPISVSDAGQLAALAEIGLKGV